MNSLHNVGNLILVDGEAHSEKENFEVLEGVRKAALENGRSERIRIAVQGAVLHSGDLGVEGPRNLLTASAVEPAIQWLGSRIPSEEPSRIEWLFDTVPNSLRTPDLATNGQGPVSQTLSIAVMLDRSQNPPQLLDYVYFLLYTIVTTGYGDLIPVSTFSKMICSFANIFELFYTVVLFGVFLKFVTPRLPVPSVGEGDGGGEGSTPA